jgi:2-polyprenyl-3-methyl-5-hydroxy-6-metoxy-1,4-benzoquinol methylase
MKELGDRCIVCRQAPLEPLRFGAGLSGVTTRADALYPFQLLHCPQCGLVQKALDADWHRAMDGLYDRHYVDNQVLGRQIGIADGTVVGRDGVAAAKLDSLLALGKTGTFLDYGCGAGRFMAAFAAQKPGWSVAGYDVGDLHKTSVMALPGAEFISGNDALKALGRRFDLITLSHVLEHLTEPVETLKTLSMLLVPGGRLVVRVPCYLAVHTDFFIMEHCAHYTLGTLASTLALAGLRVTHELSGIAAIEIGVVAETADTSLPPRLSARADAAEEALRCLAWAESLPAFVRWLPSEGRPKGLFGVGGAGLWLGVCLRGEVSFYYDEDPGKQGHEHAGLPILGANDVPSGATVFVTFNTPEASARIADRLAPRNHRIRFAVPPPVAPPPP